MANKDYDSRYNRGMARERVHASNSWNTYDGDNNSDRASQQRAWQGVGEGTRRVRRGGPGRFGQQRSTQDFQNENARLYNRGREGDQEWRVSDYDAQDYTADQRTDGYGERYGFAAEGRAHYDPDINRGWEEPEGRQSMQRSENMRRETGQNGYDHNGYEETDFDTEEPVPYASHKNGQRAHGRRSHDQYAGGQSAYRSDREPQRQRTPRTTHRNAWLTPVLVLGGISLVAGLMQVFVPKLVDSITGAFSKD